MFKSNHFQIGVATGLYAILLLSTSGTSNNFTPVLTTILAGLYGWFYGIRIGILSILLLTLLNPIFLHLTASESGHISLTYSSSETIFSILIVLATGSMRNSQKKLTQLKTTLSNRIDGATRELDTLAQQLIDHDEKFRIQIGQDLHDGIGQYLTGMLLHSEALHCKLEKDHRPEVDLAKKMTERINTSIQVVRCFSRSQLPIRLNETTLEIALGELTAYYEESSNLNFSLKCTGSSSGIPVETAQHLYRIVHEALYCAAYKCKATSVAVQFSGKEKHHYSISVKAIKIPAAHNPAADFISGVMKYRARAIGGVLSISATAPHGFLLKCSVNPLK